MKLVRCEIGEGPRHGFKAVSVSSVEGRKEHFAIEERFLVQREGESYLPVAVIGRNLTADSDQQGTKLRLEIWNVGPLPVELVQGMRICQLILEEVREVPKPGILGSSIFRGPSPSRTQQSVISRIEDADYAGRSLAILQRIASAVGKRLKLSFTRARAVRTLGAKSRTRKPRQAEVDSLMEADSAEPEPGDRSA